MVEYVHLLVDVARACSQTLFSATCYSVIPVGAIWVVRCVLVQSICLDSVAPHGRLIAHYASVQMVMLSVFSVIEVLFIVFNFIIHLRENIMHFLFFCYFLLNLVLCIELEDAVPVFFFLLVELVSLLFLNLVEHEMVFPVIKLLHPLKHLLVSFIYR